jgi:hypothetical protein
MLIALLGYAVRGRGRHRVFVVATGLPDRVQGEVDDCRLVVAATHAPARRRNGFLVLVTRPESAVDRPGL